MDEHATTRRAEAATWLARLVGRRYVLAWALTLAGASLHPALVPGAGMDWQAWMMGMLVMSAGLLGLWWIEPYLRYRYRRRRFRRLLTAEDGWRPWSLHAPLRPWRPTKTGWWRGVPARLATGRPGGRRRRVEPSPRHAQQSPAADDRLGAPSAP